MFFYGSLDLCLQDQGNWPYLGGLTRLIKLNGLEDMDLTKIICQLAKKMNVKFVLNGKPISEEEIFAETGLLPAIARRADQLCSLCLGYGIGVTFIEAEKSLLGTKVQFDEVTPNILRLACIYDVVKEIVRMSSSSEAVSLDELMYD